MKVILHIGWHKTGTSAIQYLLHANRALLREKWRLNYPEAGIYGRRAHHIAAWKLIPRFEGLLGRMGHAATPGSEELFGNMLMETADQGCTAMLISSEVLSQVLEYEPRRLAEAFKGHSVEIVAYVRRQDRYLESRYNQWVKGRRRLKAHVNQFARRFLDTNDLDYHGYFQRWAAVFGRDSLKVRVYDRTKLRQGDVRRDLLDALGIDERGFVYEEDLRNASLDFRGVQFLRRFNAIPHDVAQRRQVLRLLAEHAREQPGHSSLFSPGERRALMEQFRDSNRKFAREFLGCDDIFVIQDEELAREAELDLAYGEEQFLEMLGYVLPRLLGGRTRDRAGGAKAGRASTRPGRDKS